LKAKRFLLWDFDGTLAYREGMWGGCLVEALDGSEDAHGVTIDDVRPFLRDGFPWHAHDVPHPELSTPEAWWDAVEAVLARAYEGVGLPAGRARELAREAHLRYVDCTSGWSLFDDTLAVLESLREASWAHAILSNHVPELPQLVEGLGLSGLVDVVLTSAVTGYEKPHPEAFALALERCGRPGEVWMIGDNPLADVAGAEAVGIPAILARTEAENVGRRAATLHDVERLILGS
jgi:putative hydrolase of the HAD superfamily